MKLSKSYLFTLLLIIYSGNPAMGRIASMDVQLSLFAVILGLVYGARPSRSDTRFMAFCTIFIGVAAVQGISFYFFPLVTLIGFLLKVFIGYRVVGSVRDFPYVYVQIMFWLSILSLAFYVPYVGFHFMGISLEAGISSISDLIHTTSDGNRPLFFHTFLGSYSPRNCGIFWEPGAFSGYLTLGLIFLAFVRRRMEPKEYRRTFIILSVCLGTTLSTTGYLVYPLVLILHYNWRAVDLRMTVQRIAVAIVLIAPIIFAVSLYGFKSIDFLGEKIESQLKYTEFQQGRWYLSRFGSAMFDLEYIRERPFTGWGLHNDTRYAMHPDLIESLSGKGNGFTDFAAKFGLIGISVWFLFVYAGFREMGGGSSTSSLLVCLLLVFTLQGEMFLNYPLFLGLAFLRLSSRSTGVHSTRSYYVAGRAPA